MANEKRLIDASVIIRDLTAMKSMYDAIALDGMIKALKEAPTVDAVEVVHAKWKVECKDRLKCSNCGFGRNTETQLGWNYCPRCGAKMEE